MLVKTKQSEGIYCKEYYRGSEIRNGKYVSKMVAVSSCDHRNVDVTSVAKDTNHLNNFVKMFIKCGKGLVYKLSMSNQKFSLTFWNV